MIIIHIKPYIFLCEFWW